MTSMNELDRTLGDWMAAEALAPAPTGLLGAATAKTAARRPRAAWRAGLGGHWVGDGVAARRSGRGLALGLIVALLVALVAAVTVIVGGGLLTPTPSIVPPPGAWTPTGALAEPRQELTATLLRNGDVLVVGGWTGDREQIPVQQAELWDHETRTFSPAGTLAVGRVGHTATLLDSGKVLVIGGTDGVDGDLVAGAELWDPDTRTFSPAGTLAMPRAGHTATSMPDDGSVVVIGGGEVGITRPDGGPERVTGGLDIERWDPETRTFSVVGSLSQPRSYHTATLLKDGRVLVIGGHVAPDTVLASTELWDPKSRTSTPGPSMTMARYGHTATVFQDDRILVVGGIGTSDEAGLSSAEVWTPGTQAFHEVGTSTIGHRDHTATLLGDGRVLIVGGGSGNCCGPSGTTYAELWDPTTEAFSPAAPSEHGHAGHGAVLLRDERVFVVGAYVSSSTWRCAVSPAPPSGAHCFVRMLVETHGSAAELFDPTAGAAAP